MKIQKTLVVGLVLISGMVAAVFATLGDTPPPAQPSPASIKAKPLPLAKQPAKPLQPLTQNQALTGLYRGDWGETPIYAQHDRVDYQGAAYLSLADGNQNQPPASSPAFWQFLRPTPTHDEAACLAPAPGANLSDCDFSSAQNLQGLDLHGADLSGARLDGDLGAANLSGADLHGAAVVGSLTIHPETRLDKANMSGLQTGGNNPLIAEAAHLQGVNLNGAGLYGAKLKGADLTGASLKGATLSGADMASAQLQGSNLSKADLTYSHLAAGDLDKANLNQADLTDADLTDAKLSRASLRNANLAGSQLAGADLSGSDLRGANLAQAQGADSAIYDHATDFTAAICPDGVTVDGTQVTTCVGHGF